jgi:myosin heavy subunit
VETPPKDPNLAYGFEDIADVRYYLQSLSEENKKLRLIVFRAMVNQYKHIEVVHHQRSFKLLIDFTNIDVPLDVQSLKKANNNTIHQDLIRCFALIKIQSTNDNLQKNLVDCLKSMKPDYAIQLKPYTETNPWARTIAQWVVSTALVVAFGYGLVEASRRIPARNKILLPFGDTQLVDIQEKEEIEQMVIDGQRLFEELNIERSELNQLLATYQATPATREEVEARIENLKARQVKINRLQKKIEKYKTAVKKKFETIVYYGRDSRAAVMELPKSIQVPQDIHFQTIRFYYQELSTQPIDWDGWFDSVRQTPIEGFNYEDRWRSDTVTHALLLIIAGGGVLWVDKKIFGGIGNNTLAKLLKSLLPNKEKP